MIGSLRGSLLDRSDGGVLTVEVGGVGYRVTVAPRSAARAARVGSTVFLWVHTHVKEDALALYGFDTAEERECFESLIAAHGVGPSLAMAILSQHSPSALRNAVVHGDVEALVLVPGVGRKTAQRLLIDLASQFPKLDDAVASGTSAPGVVGEVREALAGLGYAPDEVRRAIAALPDGGEVGELLKAALKELSQTR